MWTVVENCIFGPSQEIDLRICLSINSIPYHYAITFNTFFLRFFLYIFQTVRDHLIIKIVYSMVVMRNLLSFDIRQFLHDMSNSDFGKNICCKLFLFQRLKVKTVLYFLKYVSSHFKSLIHPFLEGDMKIKYPMDTYSIIYGGNTYVLSVQLRNRVLSRVLAVQTWECAFCGAEGADYFWSQNRSPIQSLTSANAILTVTIAQIESGEDSYDLSCLQFPWKLILCRVML